MARHHWKPLVDPLTTMKRLKRMVKNPSVASLLCTFCIEKKNGKYFQESSKSGQTVAFNVTVLAGCCLVAPNYQESISLLCSSNMRRLLFSSTSLSELTQRVLDGRCPAALFSTQNTAKNLGDQLHFFAWHSNEHESIPQNRKWSFQ